MNNGSSRLTALEHLIYRVLPSAHIVSRDDQHHTIILISYRSIHGFAFALLSVQPLISVVDTSGKRIAHESVVSLFADS